MGLEWQQNPGWRETGRQVKVGPLDGRLMLFFTLFFLYPSWILFWLCVLY